MTLAKEIMSVPLWKRRPSWTWPAPVDYPESDGEPMAETDVHRDLMPLEAQAARRRAEDHATQEAKARRRAETELERLRAEIAYLRST